MIRQMCVVEVWNSTATKEIQLFFKTSFYQEIRDLFCDCKQLHAVPSDLLNDVMFLNILAFIDDKVYQ